MTRRDVCDWLLILWLGVMLTVIVGAYTGVIRP